MFNKKFLLTIILTFFFNLNVYSLENKILLKIDNEIITSVDIFLEIQYLTAINKKHCKIKEWKNFWNSKKFTYKKKSQRERNKKTFR